MNLHETSQPKGFGKWFGFGLVYGAYGLLLAWGSLDRISSAPGRSRPRAWGRLARALGAAPWPEVYWKGLWIPGGRESGELIWGPERTHV